MTPTNASGQNPHGGIEIATSDPADGDGEEARERDVAIGDGRHQPVVDSARSANTTMRCVVDPGG